MPRVICPNCSNPYTPSATLERCPRCGYGPGTQTAAATPQWSTSGASTFAPVMSPPGPSMAPPGQVHSPTVQQPTNGFAVTSMVLGIVSIPLLVLGVVTAPLALIFGIVAMSQTKKKQQKGGGMAITGIILGTVWIALAMFFFFLVTGFL